MRKTRTMKLLAVVLCICMALGMVSGLSLRDAALDGTSTAAGETETTGGVV